MLSRRLFESKPCVRGTERNKLAILEHPIDLFHRLKSSGASISDSNTPQSHINLEPPSSYPSLQNSVVSFSENSTRNSTRLVKIKAEKLPNPVLGLSEDHPTSPRTVATKLTSGPALSGAEHISKRLQKYGIVQRPSSPVLSSSTSISKPQEQPHQQHTPGGVETAVNEVLRWLFVEGGHFDDVQALMTEYSLFLRNLKIPVDRLYYGGVGLHPKLTAYLWKWEPDDFVFREMPQEIFERRNELFSPDEPFCVLEQGRADFVRIRACDEYIPPDTSKWFRSGKFQDYFALPDIHHNQSKGGLAWATKNPDGFSDEDILFFDLTLPALTTVMRLHTNDLVLRTLTGQMEKEIGERTQELVHANKQLEVQAKKQLEQFACMSHEIRTPLNCIVGLSSLMLQDDNLDQEQRDFNRMIYTSSELLSAVVDDVLDYSKMESGVFQVDIRPTNLRETISTVVLAMRQKNVQKNVQIVTIYGATLPECIETDPRRLQQVLYNLLGNAVKFSKMDGKVELSIWDTSDKQAFESSGRTLHISIKDYGKGIDPEDFESIFEPFQQASKETQSIYGGTGLGLSITSKLVERLGGTISIDSKLGEYAEFIVQLPMFPSVALESIARLMNGNMEQVVEANTASNESNLATADLESSPIDHHAPPLLVKEVALLVPPERQTPPLLIPQSNEILVEELPKPDHGLSVTKSTKPLVVGLDYAKRALPLAASNVAVSTIQSLQNQFVDAPNPSCALSKQAPRTLKVLYVEDNKINQKVLNRMLTKLGVAELDIVDNGLKAVEISAAKTYDLIFMDIEMPVMGGLEAAKLIKQRDGNKTKVIFCTAHAIDNMRLQAQEAGGDGFVSKPFNMKKIQDILDNA